LQTVAAYHTPVILLSDMVTITVYGLFDEGWRRDRLQEVAAYHRASFPELGCKNCSVCSFHSAV
jgi:hypothetical protein